MLNCNEHNIMDFFIQESTGADKENILKHVETCENCKTIFNEYKSIFENLSALEVDIPKSVNEDYFLNLGVDISNKIKLICSDVEESLVDYCEGKLDKPENFDKKHLIETHLETCRSCTQEYFLTQKILEIGSKESKLNDEYFNKLADKITEKIFCKVDSACEKAREYIPYSYTGEEIPKSFKTHLATCEDCKTEFEETNDMLHQIQTLEVSIPDNSYFETLAYKIENTINLIPSVNKTQEKRTFLSSLKQFASFLLRPQIAITSTAVLSLLVFATLTFNQHQESHTPFNFSKIANEKIDIRKATKTINNVNSDVDTASNKDLFFKNKVNSPQKDARLDQEEVETAKK